MQPLATETINPSLSTECSALLIELTPVIMRNIREEMQRRTMPGLTLPYYRTLNYLERHPRSSLSDLADYLGITLPSTSKLVQKLVMQKVVLRRAARDRRRVCLSLTQLGITAFAQARLETRQKLAENLSSLPQEELSVVVAALRVLSSAFSGGGSGVSLP